MMRVASLSLVLGVTLLTCNSKSAVTQDNSVAITNDLKREGETMPQVEVAGQDLPSGRTLRVDLAGGIKFVTVKRLLPNAHFRTYQYSLQSPGCSNSVAASVATLDTDVEFTGSCAPCSTLVQCSRGANVSTDSAIIQRPQALYFIVDNNSPNTTVDYAGVSVPFGNEFKIQEGSPSTYVTATRSFQNKTRTYRYSPMLGGCRNTVKESLDTLDAHVGDRRGCCPCNLALAPNIACTNNENICVDTSQ